MHSFAYVWGLSYRWYPPLSMKPLCRFAHFVPPWLISICFHCFLASSIQRRLYCPTWKYESTKICLLAFFGVYWRKGSFHVCRVLYFLLIRSFEKWTVALLHLSSFDLILNPSFWYFHIPYITKHRKNCECCPGRYLIVNHYSSMSWIKFRNLSELVNCVT